MAVSNELLMGVAGVAAKGITDVSYPAVDVGNGEDYMLTKELVKFKL